ncbi:MAG: tetratricopeptide repeat protein, partial [Pirellulales bacterium]|nr:tetratricopeptide repeat protein [Pirellulales bacterium]
MRRLNIKLLIILVASTIFVCAGVYFVHAWQVEGSIDSLFHEAKQSQEDKNYDNALQLYRRYLANAPTDAPFEDEARCNLAIVADEISLKEMDKGADGNIGAIRRAYSLLKDANIASPDNEDVKRRLINYYLIDRGSPNALKLADELLRELLAKSPEDVELHMQLAASQQGRARDQEAIKTLSKVVGYDEKADEFRTSKALDATSLEAYLQLAQLLSKKSDKTDAAKKVVDKMVSLNPSEYKASEYRSRYWRWRILEDTAEENHDTIRSWIEKDLAEARRLAPENGEILMASADFATEQEKHEEAESYLREAAKTYENRFTVYAKLAETLLRQGKREEALAEIRRGAEEMPDHVVLLRVQADLQLDSNSLEEAEETIERLDKALDERQLVRRTDDSMSRYYLQYLKARVSFAKQDWVAARRQFERVRPLMSTRKDVLRRVDHYLSVCHKQLGEGEKVAEGSRQGIMREIELMVSAGNLDGAVERMRLLADLNG